MKTSLPVVQWGLLPILLVPVLLSLWRPHDGSENLTAFAPVPPDRADYYLRDARMSAMGEDGLLMYQVQADEVLHYPDTSATLENVNVHYQSRDHGLWRLSAREGRMPPHAVGAQETVELSGGVTVTGQRGAEQRLTQVTMPNAIVRPGAGTLQTDAAVKVQEPGVVADAQGLELDIVNDKLALQKNVRVRYVPEVHQTNAPE